MAGRGRIVNRGELLLLHWRLVLMLVLMMVARVTPISPTPVATGRRGAVPAGGAVVMRMGRLRLGLRTGLRQKRGRRGLRFL